MYRELSTSLRISLRRMVFCFKLLFFMIKLGILEESESLFLKLKLKLTKIFIWKRRSIWFMDMTSTNSIRKRKLFVALIFTHFPFYFFLMLLMHQEHHVQFSRFRQVFPKCGLYMEHFYYILYEND